MEMKGRLLVVRINGNDEPVSYRVPVFEDLADLVKHYAEHDIVRMAQDHIEREARMVARNDYLRRN